MILHITSNHGLTRIYRGKESGAIIIIPRFGAIGVYHLGHQDGIVAGSGSLVEVECNFPVIAGFGSRVRGFQGSQIVGQFGSDVTANEGSFVRAEHGSFITAFDGARVDAFAGSQIKARIGSHIIAHKGASVDAFSGATVVKLRW